MIKMVVHDYDTGHRNTYIGSEEECEYVLRRDYPHETIVASDLVSCVAAVSESGRAGIEYEIHRPSAESNLFSNSFDLDLYPEDPKTR